MNKRRVLVAWIGHSDLKAMAASWKNSAGAEILAELGGAQPTAREIGPIKALIDAEPFDEIRLLSNFRPAWNKSYRDWLGKKATIIRVELEKPTDYPAIFRSADAELARLARETADNPVELCIHLSPGTPPWPPFGCCWERPATRRPFMKRTRARRGRRRSRST